MLAGPAATVGLPLARKRPEVLASVLARRTSANAERRAAEPMATASTIATVSVGEIREQLLRDSGT